MSSNRPDFLARMFARKRPAGLSEKSTADDLFNAYLNAQPMDNDAFEKSLQEIKDLLVNFPPTVAISRLVNSLKGVSSRRLRQEFPDLRRHFAGSVGGALL